MMVYFMGWRDFEPQGGTRWLDTGKCCLIELDDHLVPEEVFPPHPSYPSYPSKIVETAFKIFVENGNSPCLKWFPIEIGLKKESQ